PKFSPSEGWEDSVDNLDRCQACASVDPRCVTSSASSAGVFFSRSTSIKYRTMATRTDVRRIALSFPETREQDGHFAFEVLNGRKYKGFSWVWMHSIDQLTP